MLVVLNELSFKVKEKSALDRKNKFLINTDIKIQNLSFNYNDNSDLFNAMNFKIKKNKLNFFVWKKRIRKNYLNKFNLMFNKTTEGRNVCK